MKEEDFIVCVYPWEVCLMKQETGQIPTLEEINNAQWWKYSTTNKPCIEWTGVSQ